MKISTVLQSILLTSAVSAATTPIRKRSCIAPVPKAGSHAEGAAHSNVNVAAAVPEPAPPVPKPSKVPEASANHPWGVSSSNARPPLPQASITLTTGVVDTSSTNNKAHSSASHPNESASSGVANTGSKPAPSTGSDTQSGASTNNESAPKESAPKESTSNESHMGESTNSGPTSSWPTSGASSYNSGQSSTSASSSGSSSSDTLTGGTELSGGKPMISSINAYRLAAGLPAMKWNATLVGNALKTGDATGGKSMRHMMNKGTYGQVLVPGFEDRDICKREMGAYTPFELFYLSWLCEVPSDAALGGVCGKVLKMSSIYNGGQTGHWKILSSAQYSKIGCAFSRNAESRQCGQFTGIWACDVGY